MVFLGDANHLTVSSAQINTKEPIPSTVCLQQSKASPSHLQWTKCSLVVPTLPDVHLSGCMTQNVHRFSTFSSSALRFYGCWMMQYQSHLIIWYTSSVSVSSSVPTHNVDFVRLASSTTNWEAHTHPATVWYCRACSPQSFLQSCLTLSCISSRCNLDSEKAVWLTLPGHASREPPRDM